MDWPSLAWWLPGSFCLVELLLANRSFLYALAARAYAEEVDAAFAELLAGSHAREELGLVESDETPAVLELRDELAGLLTQPDGVQEAAREYVRIFVGPGTLRADPYETVQLTGKRQLFQPGVLDVRDAYREAGFLPVRYREVPDDFIGIELDFMAKLAARAQDEHAAGDAAWRETLRQSQAFLNDHLLKWTGKLADSIAAEYGESFYARFTRLVDLIAQRDAKVLDELL